MKKLKFTQRKRLSNQLDYLLRYMISLSGYDKIKEIEINKDILKIILPIPKIPETKENKKIGALYGINLTPTDKMKIEIKQ